MTSSTLRGKSVSKEQKLLIVTLLEENIDLANDRFDGINGKVDNRESWQKIAAQLNSLGGANKDGEKWRRAWVDMKKYVRGQWTSLKEFDNRTGLGMEGPSRRPNQLSVLDQRILDVIHKEACERTEATDEGGFELTSQQARTSNMGLLTNAATEINTNSQNDTGLSSTIAAPIQGPYESIKSKRIRGSAYTRDKILDDSNKIETKKVAALNRIAAAMEERNHILKQMIKEKNSEPNALEEYLDTTFLEDE